MIGRAIGRGDRAGAGRVVTQAFTLALIVGVVALILLQAFAVPILTLMGADEALREPALVYLRIRALAGPALLLITAGNGAFRGYQDTRTPFVITLWLNLVNLVLDPLFIFGFGWGLAGRGVGDGYRAVGGGALVCVALAGETAGRSSRYPSSSPTSPNSAPSYASVGSWRCAPLRSSVR